MAVFFVYDCGCWCYFERSVEREARKEEKEQTSERESLQFLRVFECLSHLPFPSSEENVHISFPNKDMSIGNNL